MHARSQPSHVWLVAGLAILAGIAGALDERYDETLTIRPLADGKVHSNFNFTVTASGLGWDASPSGSVTTFHTNLLPHALTDIVRTYAVDELHLSLARGRWDHRRWGKTVSDGSPSGGEMFAWLADYEDDTVETIQSRWRSLTNALGGLFCSSLHNLDEKVTTSPIKAFLSSTASSPSSKFFHAMLPLEHPCTENLTPFIGLLPCRSKAGLAELLNPFKLFDANWQKIAVHVVRDEENDTLAVTLEVEVVQDPVRTSLAAGNLPRRDWSFRNLYDRTVTRDCPIAASSTVDMLIEDDQQSGDFTLHVPSDKLQLTNAQDIRSLNIASYAKPFKLDMQWPASGEGFIFPRTFKPAAIVLDRINSGYGRESAQLGVEITNNGQQAADVTWMEVWPWWIKVYMHTLSVIVDGQSVDQASVITNMRYRQAHPRGRPTLIECDLLLRPNSTTAIVVDVDKAYLRYTDYPPDSERGFDVPSALLLHPVDSSLPGSPRRRTYSAPTLLDMPTPDFSMPYNVIILTSTIIALFFGSVFNALTRRWLLVDVREETTSEIADTALSIQPEEKPVQEKP